MRVLAPLPLYPPAHRVGAFLATHDWLTAVAEAGHQVDVVKRLGSTGEYTYNGVTVHPADAGDRLAQSADLIVSHLGDDGWAQDTATTLGIPWLVLIHGIVPAAPPRLEGASFVAAVSQVALSRSEWTGPSTVINPPTFPDRHRVHPIGNRITQVNLSEAKGGRMFWTLAHALPVQRFLGVRGGYGGQIIEQAPSNVDIWPIQPDMRKVWSQTRLLLVPSVFESWGMVALEAACSGIPTVASDVEGLAASLDGGAGALVDVVDSEGWVDTVRELATDQRAWVRASERARARAERLDPVGSLSAFVDVVEVLV